MSDKNSPRTPRYRVSKSGERSQQTYAFHLRDATLDDRMAIEDTVSRMIAEHDTPDKVIYTTLTGRTADGRPFAEATLLPVGDSIRLTIGGGDMSALGTSLNDMRRLVAYMLSSYLAIAYDMSTEDAIALCELADQEAERAEAEERAAESDR